MKKSLPCFSVLVAASSASAAIAQPSSRSLRERAGGDGLSPPSASCRRPADAAVRSNSRRRSTAGASRQPARTPRQRLRAAATSSRHRRPATVRRRQLLAAGEWRGAESSARTSNRRARRQAAASLQQPLPVDRSPLADRPQRHAVRPAATAGRPVARAAEPRQSSRAKPTGRPIQPVLTAFTGGLPSLLAALERELFLPAAAGDAAGDRAAAHRRADERAGVRRRRPMETGKAGRAARENASQLAPTANRRPPPNRSTPDKTLPGALAARSVAAGRPGRPVSVSHRVPATGNARRQPNGDGPPIPYQLSVHPMVVLEMSDVVFDAPIDAGQFDYTPGDADWVDQTTAILERLRQQNQGASGNAASGRSRSSALVSEMCDIAARGCHWLRRGL